MENKDNNIDNKEIEEKVGGVFPVKIIELLASSAAIIGIFTYISGSLILTSFFKSQFGINYYFGTLLPQAIFSHLGFILILSTIVPAPYLYFIVTGGLDKKTLREGGYIASVILLCVLIFIANIINKYKVNEILQSSLKVTPVWFQAIGPVIAYVLLVMIFAMFAWKIAIMLNESRKHKGRIYRIIYPFINPSETTKFYFIILTPLFFSQLISLIQSFSSGLIGQNPLINSIDFLILYKNYYISFCFSIAVILFALKQILSYSKLGSWLKILLISGYFLGFIYGFSELIGKAISESYLKNNIGIFPKASIIFTNTNSGNRAPMDITLISKDDSSYYGFNPSDKKLIIIPSNLVEQVTIKSEK